VTIARLANYSPQNKNTKTCAGFARGLAGNTRLYADNILRRWPIRHQHHTLVHAFVGVVERSFSNAGGATYIDTHGYGSTASGVIGESRDWINSLGGPAIFSGLDFRAAAYAAANYKGC
jgi:hypothetical protein